MTKQIIIPMNEITDSVEMLHDKPNSGNHFELMDKRGCYYELWKEQLPQNNDTAISVCTALPTVV